MRATPLRAAVPLLAVVLALPAHASSSRTWFVRAGATGGGTGTSDRPLGSLAAVHDLSRPGDTIVVLPSRAVLDGGIALRPRQRLVGAGPAVTMLAAGAVAPQLTNTSADHLAGDAVRLADGATVQNLRIAGAVRGAVYGLDVSGVRVSGLDVTGHNTSCTKGFLIPQFNAPTNVPGVGAPIPGGLQNGWAAVMVDAGTRRGATVTLDHNRVHDATCGDGLDVRVYGTASYHATITSNDVRRLGQGRTFLSLLAIGLQTRDHGSLTALVDRNTQTDLGNKVDLNAGQGADSEGVFVNGVDRSRIDVTVSHDTYSNPLGYGGFSANGLEAVTMNAGSQLSVHVSDSTFTGSTGDVIEEGALGTDAQLTMTLDRVTAERSSGIGNTVLLPFNNGDCLLAGSLGARNAIRLVVRDSALRHCSNNGLAVGSNVVNGHGATRSLVVRVDRTVITGNRGGNLGIRNFTDLDALSVVVTHADLRGRSGVGSAVAALSVEDLGSTGTSAIDVTGSCIEAVPLSADVVDYRVGARRNWWGQPTGPAPGQTVVVGGALDASSPLISAPACGS